MIKKRKGFNDYKIIDNETVIIFLENNKGEIVGETKIDYKNLQRLIDANIHWYKEPDFGRYKKYVMASERYIDENGIKRGRTLRLHSWLMNQGKREFPVDHIDGDGFNNRESNLRVSTVSNNIKNRRSKNSNNTSGFRNVSSTKNGTFVVQLQINGRNKNFGEFLNIEDAILVAEKERIKNYGEYMGKS